MNSISHMPRRIPEALPLVVTQGSFTAIADTDVMATYEGQSMSVGFLDPPPVVSSKRDLEDLVAAKLSCKEPHPVPPFRILSTTPAFAPLLRPGHRGRLSRLTINIANACNLWCSYCYADHGTYHAPASLMTTGQAVQVAARALELYSHIRTVQFFGGEPLLNPSAIDSVCVFLEQRLGSDCPEFVATTNGTILNDEVERILERHHIGLTISVDGPQHIHDHLRPANRVAGSHSSILNNVTRLKELGIHFDFECTYTSAHTSSGITVCDLIDYFADVLDEPTPHIGWSYLPRPGLASDASQKQLGIFRNDINLQCKEYLPVQLVASQFRVAAKKSMSNIANGCGGALDFVVGIVDRLAKRQPAVAYCPAFTTQMSVAADGSVYPCFMFIGDPRFKIGNILDSAFPGDDAERMWERYSSDFGPHVMGSNAWYSTLLSGCIAGDYVSTGSLGERLYEPVQEAMIQEVLLGLARFLRFQTQGGSDHGS